MLCERCQQDLPVTYRVESREEGKIYLDMRVCAPCSWDAQRLGLKVTPIGKKTVVFLLEE